MVLVPCRPRRCFEGGYFPADFMQVKDGTQGCFSPNSLALGVPPIKKCLFVCQLVACSLCLPISLPSPPDCSTFWQPKSRFVLFHACCNCLPSSLACAKRKSNFKSFSIKPSMKLRVHCKAQLSATLGATRNLINKPKRKTEFKHNLNANLQALRTNS